MRTLVRPPSPSRSTRIEQRRRRLRGSFGSQAPQPLPTRGTPPDEPQPRIRRVSVAIRISRSGRIAGREARVTPLRRGPVEQAEEIRRGDAGDLLFAHLQGGGESARGVGGIGRLVGAPAVGLGGEERRVGLHEDPVAGHLRAMSRKSCERRKVTMPRRRRTGRSPPLPRPAGPRREAMQHRPKRRLGHLLRQHLFHVRVRVASMDDEGQPGEAGRLDMGAQHTSPARRGGSGRDNDNRARPRRSRRSADGRPVPRWSPAAVSGSSPAPSGWVPTVNHTSGWASAMAR